MKKLLLGLMTLGSLSAYTADLSCFVDGEEDKVIRSFSDMVVVKGENQIMKYSVMADEQTIISIKITDQSTGASARITGLNSSRKVATLSLEQSNGESVNIDCVLK